MTKIKDYIQLHLNILLFSWRILKEKISRGKIIGNLIIILGILVYTL